MQHSCLGRKIPPAALSQVLMVGQRCQCCIHLPWQLTSEDVVGQQGNESIKDSLCATAQCLLSFCETTVHNPLETTADCFKPKHLHVPHAQHYLYVQRYDPSPCTPAIWLQVKLHGQVNLLEKHSTLFLSLKGLSLSLLALLSFPPASLLHTTASDLRFSETAVPANAFTHSQPGMIMFLQSTKRASWIALYLTHGCHCTRRGQAEVSCCCCSLGCGIDKTPLNQFSFSEMVSKWNLGNFFLNRISFHLHDIHRILCCCWLTLILKCTVLGAIPLPISLLCRTGSWYKKV